MIICPTQKFVFVHIPKCAGTSVRTQIVKCDPAFIEMGRTGTHPVLGKIDYGHIPLPLLREHFPDKYDYLLRLTSYAVVRDPLDRFGSSLRQMLWRYEKRPMTLIPAAEVRDKALRAIERLAGEIDNPGPETIFFARQGSFVFDGATRVTQHLIPVGLLPAFIGYLARKTGTPMETGVRANQNVELKYKGIGKLAYGLNGFLRERLPTDLHSRIKDTALRLMASKKSAAEASGVLDIPEVQQFVTETYAGDIALYQAVMAQREAILAGLKSGDLAPVPLPAPAGAV